MNRSDLRNLVHAHRPASAKPGGSLPPQALDAIHAALLRHYSSDAGKAEIAAGPLWRRDKTPAEIADDLMKDVPGLDR